MHPALVSNFLFLVDQNEDAGNHFGISTDQKFHELLATAYPQGNNFAQKHHRPHHL
jgi:hypothetical protein